MSNKRVFISAILAGICIGIGGTVYLSLDNKVLGSLFFTIGLLTICSHGLHLYTSKVCYIFDYDSKYKLQVTMIWTGNLIGTGLVAFLVRMTRLAEKLVSAAEKLCSTKLADEYISLFILGMLCNVMIYIAVDGYNKIEMEIGKYSSLCLGVMVFIICGFEHSIADMFYFWVKGGYTVEVIVRLLVITAGNAVGGIMFHNAKKYMASLK